MRHLLIARPLQQAIRSLQANVRRFQGDLGDGEAGHIGGDQGGVAAYALPSNKVLRNLENFNLKKYLVELYSAGVVCFKAGTFSTKLSTPKQRLVSKESATVATWQGVISLQGSGSVVLIYLSQGSAIASLHHLRYFILQGSL